MNFIINPVDNKKYQIDSIQGKLILKRYIQQYKSGGTIIGHGTSKCVLSPPVRCRRKKTLFKRNTTERNRYTRSDIVGDDPKNYVGFIMEKESAENEKEILEIIRKIDPKEDYMLTVIERECNIGHLDAVDGTDYDFTRNCPNLKDYDYPYYKRGKSLYAGVKNNKNLTQLIMKKGGISLNNAIINRKILKSDILYSIVNVIRGLIKLNEHNYVHADIKEANLLYNNKERKTYIIDFGLSCLQKTYLEEYSYLDINYEYWAEDLKASIILNLSFMDDSKLKELLSMYVPDSVDKEIRLIKDNLYSYMRHKDIRDRDETIKKLLTKTIEEKMEYIDNSINKFDVYSLGITLKKLGFREQFFYNRIRKELGYSRYDIHNIKIDLSELYIDAATFKMDKILKKKILDKGYEETKKHFTYYLQ